MTRYQPADSQAAFQAADWLHRLACDDSPQCRAQFDQWLREGAGHVEEYLLAKATWTALGYLDPMDLPEVRPAQNSVVEFRGATIQPLPDPVPQAAHHTTKLAVHRRVRYQWIAAAAIGVVSLSGALLQLFGVPGTQVYTTPIGGQQAVKLSDGSVLHLNTHSRVEVRVNDHERTVRLLAGEALFIVAHDPTRPFIVMTENAAVQALGTKFNVYRSADNETRVAVVDGVVQVSSPQDVASPADTKHSPPHSAAAIAVLAAGDEAKVIQSRVVKAAEPNVQRAVSWRARRLMFRGDRLEDIAREFNRYSYRQIRVQDEEVRNRIVSGIFDADDPSPLIEFLSQFPEVVIVPSAEEILLRARTPLDELADNH